MVTIYIMGDGKAGRATNGDFGTEFPDRKFPGLYVSRITGNYKIAYK